jgi:hypothetical protein
VDINFKGVSDAIDALARVLGTFSESLRNAAQAGVDVFDLFTARRHHKALVRIMRDAEHIGGYQLTLVCSLQRFIDEYPDITDYHFQDVETHVSKIAEVVDRLSKELYDLQSDFVFDKSYGQLIKSLEQRRVLLSQLKDFSVGFSHKSVPHNQVEIVLSKYRELIINLDIAKSALVEYAYFRGGEKSAAELIEEEGKSPSH